MVHLKESSLASNLPFKEPESLSRAQRWLLDEKRGLVVPSEMVRAGELAPARPQTVNLQTVSSYYNSDMIAFDRLILTETNRKMKLYNFQRIMYREFLKRQFLWIQMMRGGGKTSTIARVVLNYALMHSSVPIILTGPSFRQSLMIFDEIVRIIENEKRNANGYVQLWNELKTEPTRNTMGALITLKNGSTIKAVPTGDGRKIRGLRGGVLVVDESYQMTEEMYESHLKPMTGVTQGDMPSKIIHLTTSWYQDCFAWERLMQIAAEVKAGNPLYGILDFNLDDLVECEFPLDPAIYKDAKRHGNPVTYLMTYYNVWPSSGFRWYEQKVIDDAQLVENGVKVELQRPKGDDSDNVYFLVVDIAASEKGDSTVILAFKWDGERAQLVYGKSGKKIGPNERAWLVHQTRRKFNPAFIIYDSHGAIGVDLRDTLSKDKLLTDDGAVKTVEPIVHIDDYQLKGAKLLIPVSSKHPAVVRALTGMPKDGRIEGEDGLNALMHTKCRDLLWEHRIQGPSVDGATFEDGQNYSDSEVEAADTIREAFNQLGQIGLAKDANNQQVYTKTQQLVFRTKSTVHDDGAMCIVYSTIGILRLMDGKSPNDTRPAPLARSMSERPKPLPGGRSRIVVQTLKWA